MLPGNLFRALGKQILGWTSDYSDLGAFIVIRIKHADQLGLGCRLDP